MLDALYEWIQNLVFFLLLAGMMLDVLPDGSYRKYVRFFAGMVVILLLVSPVLKLSGIKQNFDGIYHGDEYERMLREVEMMEECFEEAGEGFWQDETGEDVKNADMEGIEVEEIRIGE